VRLHECGYAAYKHGTSLQRLVVVQYPYLISLVLTPHYNHRNVSHVFFVCQVQRWLNVDDRVFVNLSYWLPKVDLAAWLSCGLIQNRPYIQGLMFVGSQAIPSNS
jgi:hypothetical protein